MVNHHHQLHPVRPALSLWYAMVAWGVHSSLQKENCSLLSLLLEQDNKVCIPNIWQLVEFFGIDKSTGIKKKQKIGLRAGKTTCTGGKDDSLNIWHLYDDSPTFPMAIEFWYLDSAWECFAWSQAHKQVAAGHSSDVVFASSFHLSIHPSIFGWSFLVAKYSWISWIWCEVFVVSFQMKNERVILSSFDHHRTSWCHCGLETHSFFVYVLASEKNISKRISWNQKTLNFAKKDKDMSVLKKGNGKKKWCEL